MLMAFRSGGDLTAFWLLLGFDVRLSIEIRACWMSSHGAQCLMPVLLKVVEGTIPFMLERLLSACNDWWEADQLEPALIAAIKRRNFQSAKLIIAAVGKRMWSPLKLAAALAGP
jgi:hypothetical protein